MKFRVLHVAFFILCFGTISSYGQYYRSAVAGSWSVASNWESSTDNITWITCATVPDNNATAITMSHDIISSGSLVVDDITIEAGATLTVSGGAFTLNNGSAITDMQVNGTFTFSGGTFTQNASAGIDFGATATYNHSIASTTLTLPIASWNPTSNCNVTGMTNASSIVGVNMGQAFGNFTWNNPGQISATAYVNIQNSGFSVVGTMTVGPYMNNCLSFGDTGIFTNTVNRLVVSGGYLSVSGNANVSLNVINDVVVTGTDAINYGSFVISGGTGTAILNIGTDLTISVSGHMQVLSVANSPNQTVTIGRDLLISGALGSQLNLEVVSAPGFATVTINRDFICTSSNVGIPAIDFGDGNVSNNIINIGRNFNKTGGGFFTTLSNTNFAKGFSFNGIGNQMFSYTGNNSSHTSYVIQSASTLIMNSNLTLGINTNPASRFTLATGGTLNFGTYSIIAGNTTDPTFTANTGSTLITANSNGIGGTSATGSVQGFGSVGINTLPGRAAFANRCNYTFNGDTITPFPNGLFIPGINILNVNAHVTPNISSNSLIISGIVTGSGALNVNNGGTFILSSPTNNLLLNDNSVLNIASGGTFDVRDERKVIFDRGIPSIIITGRFITSDTQGFVGPGSSIPIATSIPVLNPGSTVEYSKNGDQVVQGATAPTYQNVTFSGSGTKTLTGDNIVAGTITVSDSAIFDASNYVFGGTGTNITMTGNSIYRLSGSGLKPEATGIYSLTPGTAFEFYGAFGTTIKTGVSSPVIAYSNVIVTGTNVSNPNTTDGIQFQSGGKFTVKSGATFKLFNTSGFNGNATAAVSSNNNPNIVLETGSLIEYAGASQTVTLFNSPSYSNVTISGTGIKSLQNATQTFINENLNINGSVLLVNTNEVLTVRKAVKIATVVTTDIPDFQIKNHGQLIQIDETDANSGINAKVERIATVNKNDYVYWSSPTDGFDMATIPSSGSRRYIWNTTFVNLNGTQGNWSGASGAMIKGKGYAIAVPNSFPTRPDLPTGLTTTFTGKLNNGQFTFPIFRGNYNGGDYDADPTNPTNSLTTKFDDNWNLVGNPYPSAIDAEKFLILNPTSIEGTIWIWKHGIAPTSTTSPFYSNFVYNYSSTDYLKYNLLGSTDTTFGGKIASGQGFMVCMKSGIGSLVSAGATASLNVYTRNINFNNNLRSVNTTFAPYNNTDFYRTTSNQTETSGEKHRIWLDIINNTSNQIDTTLLGYASNATLGKDNFYDGIFVPRGEVNLFSLINDESFIIQGRPLPFEENDVVPMGVNIVSAGSHTIAIKKTDGIFVDEVSIYLEDTQLNSIHDLKQSPYVFDSQTGIFNNRFLLRYTNTTLGNPNFETLENSVVVATNRGELTIKSNIENIQDISVYDILGRQLFDAKRINKTSFMASNISTSQQALIVKIKLENGTVISKKVLL